MQMTILGFYQKEAEKMGLDIVDLVLLRWFVNFSQSEGMKGIQIGSKVFYWVYYQGVVDNYPILNLKKDTVYRRFKMMANKGILERFTLKRHGTYSLYRIGPEYYKLPLVLNKV